MAEKTLKDADSVMLKKDGNRRINESINKTKTPEQEIKDAKDNPTLKARKPFGPK